MWVFVVRSNTQGPGKSTSGGRQSSGSWVMDGPSPPAPTSFRVSWAFMAILTHLTSSFDTCFPPQSHSQGQGLPGASAGPSTGGALLREGTGGCR